MSATALVLRGLASLAAVAGYSVVRGRQAARRLSAGLRPQHGWVVRQLGNLIILVPKDWGEFEPDGCGGYVIHNRPREQRIDGDAVWYGSAIELRIRPLTDGLRTDDAAMETTTRVLDTVGGRIVLILAVAGGVQPRMREVAFAVLEGAHVAPGSGMIPWENARPASLSHEEMPHERVAVWRSAIGPATSRRV